MIGFLLQTRKTHLLAIITVLIAAIASADWAVGNAFSLGVLYIVPMMFGALFLRPPGTAVLASICALLRWRFDVPSTAMEAALRFVFGFTSYVVSGLFVNALVRNRRLMASHLTETSRHLAEIENEQRLREEAEEQIRALVASSPAAIVTTDANGLVLAANHAANSLFSIPEQECLVGRPIVDYVPILFDALRLENLPDGFRTSAQCQGRRANGEIFFANTWFSSYDAKGGRRLAAIVVDTSEEMREREEQNLRHLQESNRITTSAVSHELKNLCGAISLICNQLEAKYQVDQDDDIQALANLVNGLEKLASLELQRRANENADLTPIPLKAVLDNLRIVINSQWEETNGTVHWKLPKKLPCVFADAHGLLQVFLNLSQNSLRAVQTSAVKELEISVLWQDGKIIIPFKDTGPGIICPDRLFKPFHESADGTGLGLYVSRAMVRSYAGDLRLVPQQVGSCFVVELRASGQSDHGSN